MRQYYLVVLVIVCLALPGCGDSTTAPRDFNDIGGTYAGVLSGIAQGVQLNATFTLTINQSGGTLSGAYGMTGTLNDGLQAVAVQGSGSVQGTIQSGENPSVDFSLVPGGCPSTEERFSGAYDTTNRRLTVSGPVHVFNAACEAILTYASTIVLTN